MGWAAARVVSLADRFGIEVSLRLNPIGRIPPRAQGTSSAAQAICALDQSLDHLGGVFDRADVGQRLDEPAVRSNRFRSLPVFQRVGLTALGLLHATSMARNR